MIPLLFAITLAHAAENTPASEFESERLRQLKAVKRVYVDKLSGENSDHLRDLLIASLQESGLFILTENPERADATLRGSTQYNAYIDSYQYGDGINSRGSSGSSRSTRNPLRSGSYGVGENESARITERRETAAATLRMVNSEGDVIWSATQESRGAKFRGAASDVAEKIARKLLDDYARARRLTEPK